MFESSLVALVFFFGIFWATILSTVPDYKLFVVGKPLRRWAIGIGILNVFPLGILLLLSWMSSIFPDQVWLSIICAAIASLSVFSTFFFLQAIIATFLPRLKYDKTEMEDLTKILGRTDERKGCCAVVIGLLYFVGWPILALLIGIIFG